MELLIFLENIYTYMHIHINDCHILYHQITLQHVSPPNSIHSHNFWSIDGRKHNKILYNVIDSFRPNIFVLVGSQNANVLL